ncbi:MAG: hypothetical protein QM725_00420 [Lacibacter sp.]
MKKIMVILSCIFASMHLMAQTSVTTNKAYDVKADRASCQFTVLSNDYNTIDQRGATWSQSHNPTINYFKANAPMTPLKLGGVTFGGLKPNTQYYVRAFVMLKNGEIIYGNELSFKTIAATNENKNQNTGKKTETKEQPQKKN